MLAGSATPTPHLTGRNSSGRSWRTLRLILSSLTVMAVTVPLQINCGLTFPMERPVVKGGYENFGDVFFATQVTTALLYDSLFPLMRRADSRPSLKTAIGGVLGDYLRWTHHRPIHDVRKFRVEAAHALGLFLDRHGLAATMKDLETAGRTRPETLLFSAFGIPSAVKINFGESNGPKSR